MKDVDPFNEFIDSYVSYLNESFTKLWEKVNIEYDKLDAYAVIGGLLSRQVTLSMEMARSPGIWNGHSAPLFLRAMTDLHIALAWIMLDLEERSKKYILHGLGDEKLLIEHYKKEIEGRDEPLIQEMINARSGWINAQRREFLVEVNLGNWAQLDYRKMAQEAGCEGLYNFAYKPFSQVSHNMWSHISRYNSKICENPLHKYHLVPCLFEAELDRDFLYRSCKYVQMAYDLFLKKFSLKLECPMPLEWWEQYFSSKNEDNLNEN